MRMLGDNIMVELIEESNDGIVKPDTIDKENPTQGKAMAVGADASDIKEGDTLLFRKYAPETFEVEGKKVLIINVSDVLAVI